TGFTCAAGFNIVASATQNGRQLIAVIMGAPNTRSRMIMAAALFDRGFSGIDQPSKSLADLMARTSANSPAAAPDMGQSICRKRGRAVVEFNTEIARVMAPLLARTAKVPSATQPPPQAEAGSPLAPAPDALPMKGQGAHAKIAAKPVAAKRVEAHRRGHAHGKMTAARAEKRHASRKAVKTAHNKAAAKPKAGTHKKLMAKQH